MNDEKIISSLRIRKLFGEYDIDIDFKKITVLVGKNGLGKTTLLKVIQGLLTGDYHINYSEICESIEMTLNDKHVISYSMVNTDLKDLFFRPEITERLLNDDGAFEKINNAIERKAQHTEEEKKTIIREYFENFVKSKFFLDKAQDFFNKEMENNKNKIFLDKKHRSKLLTKINIRYISTVSISANAERKIDAGNSIEFNLLDMAIQVEIRKIIKEQNSSLLEEFKREVDVFLSESGKECVFNRDELNLKLRSSDLLSINHLSSGERQLLYILATAANTRGKPTLFLMDEPEVSLHLSWQEKIIDAIMALNPQMQIIAVTHSPGIIMNGHMDAYVEMKDVIKRSDNV